MCVSLQKYRCQGLHVSVMESKYENPPIASTEAENMIYNKLLRVHAYNEY